MRQWDPQRNNAFKEFKKKAKTHDDVVENHEALLKTLSEFLPYYYAGYHNAISEPRFVPLKEKLYDLLDMNKMLCKSPRVFETQEEDEKNVALTTIVRGMLEGVGAREAKEARDYLIKAGYEAKLHPDTEQRVQQLEQVEEANNHRGRRL